VAQLNHQWHALLAGVRSTMSKMTPQGFVA
jgi:hypothetical protein